MQADGESGRWPAERRGGLSDRQPVPRDEHEDLPVLLAQLHERSDELAAVAVARRCGRAALGFLEALQEPCPSSRFPGARRHHVARHSQEPGEGIVRDRLVSPPRHEEGLGDNVFRVLEGDPSCGVAEDGGPMRGEQALEVSGSVQDVLPRARPPDAAAHKVVAGRGPDLSGSGEPMFGRKAVEEARR